MTDQFTYISIFLSIVVALALTQVLAGIVGLIRARIVRVSFVHAVWVGVALFACVDYWFSLWGLRTTEHWSLAYVLYLLFLATLLYVVCDLVVPAVGAGDRIDLVAFNDANGSKYLAAYFLYQATAVIANLTIAGFETAALLNIVFVTLIAVAWRWRGPRVQAVTAVLVLALVVYYAITYIPSL